MRNLFKSNRKKTPKIQLRPDDIKIPLPMINGVQFADMTDSELTILISGRREERKNLEISINNNSEVKNNSSFEAKIATTPLDNTTQPTTSKKSSLPAFTASISAHSLMPLTQSLYRTYVDEKTQVENQSISSNDSTDDDSSDIEFLLSNVMPSNISQTKERKLLTHQLSSDITKENDNSNTPHISTSKLPILTTSSPLSNFNQVIERETAIFFQSFPPSRQPNNIANIKNFNKMSEKSRSSNATVVHQIIKPSTATITYYTETSPLYKDNNNNNNSYPVISNDNTSVITTNKQVKYLPKSSSSSSFIINHDIVTQSPQNVFVKDSNTLCGTQLQIATISSEPSKFPVILSQKQNNNHHSNINMGINDCVKGNSNIEMEILQSQLDKMALNEDLLELKYTVNRIQQQRLVDLEEHLKRVEDQKLRENEILEQIYLTKRQLEDAITTGKLFPSSLGNYQQQNTATIPIQTDTKKVGDRMNEDIKDEPVMKTSRSTTIHGDQKIIPSEQKDASNKHHYNNRYRKRRSFPYAMNYHGSSFDDYFPEINANENHDFVHYSHFQNHNEYTMNNQRQMTVNKNHTPVNSVDAIPARAYQGYHYNSHSRRPRSRSMESRWVSPSELEDQDYFYYPSNTHQFQYYPNNTSYFMEDDFAFFPYPPSLQHHNNRSRKSSLHSAKSNISDNADNNNNSNNRINNSGITLSDENSRSTDQPNSSSSNIRTPKIATSNINNSQNQFNMKHPEFPNFDNGNKKYYQYVSSQKQPYNLRTSHSRPQMLGRDNNTKHHSSSIMHHHADASYRVPLSFLPPPPPPPPPPINLNTQDSIKMRQHSALPPTPYRLENFIPLSGNDYLSYMPLPPHPTQLAKTLSTEDPQRLWKGYMEGPPLPWEHQMNIPDMYTSPNVINQMNMFPYNDLLDQQEERHSPNMNLRNRTSATSNVGPYHYSH